MITVIGYLFQCISRMLIEAGNALLFLSSEVDALLNV